ncbi:MAG: hypothetical protein ACKVH8_18450 [Pirellulales bacterium]
MKILSRRLFLNTSLYSIGSLATPALGSETEVNPLWCQASDVQTTIYREVQSAQFQLKLFRDNILHLLLRRPWSHTEHLCFEFDEPNPNEMVAYQYAINQLLNALPDNGNVDSSDPLDHDNIVSLILDLQSRPGDYPRDLTGLYQRSESDPCLTNYCVLSEQGIQWDIGLMRFKIRQDALVSFADEIAGYLEETRDKSNSIHAIQIADELQILRAFSKMPLEVYWQLLLPLFTIPPTSLLAVLTLRRSSASRRVKGFSTPQRSYLYYMKMSSLCAYIMEILADNHFLEVQKIAGLRETLGSWRGFMAPLILDVLYQKVIVLRRLIANKNDRSQIFSMKPAMHPFGNITDKTEAECMAKSSCER